MIWRSDCVMTAVVAVALLFAAFASADDVTVATFDSVVDAVVFGSTCATTVNVAPPPDVSDAVVHVTEPVAPTAGVVHDQPAGFATDTNVVLADSASVSVMLFAVLGPRLLTGMV